METKFYCQSCGSKLSAGEELFGTNMDCPACGMRIVVPRPTPIPGLSGNNFSAGRVIPTIRPPSNPVVDRNNASAARKADEDVNVSRPNKSSSAKGRNSLRSKGAGAASGIRTSPYAANKRGNSALLVPAVLVLLLAAGILTAYLIGGEKRNQIPETLIVRHKLEPVPHAAPETIDMSENETLFEANPDEPELVPDKGKYLKFETLEEKELDVGNAGVCKVVYGQFLIEANLHRNEAVLVYYAVPVDRGGKPVPTASNIVFHCPYYPERDFFKRAHFRWFPEHAGYTFFSFKIISSLSEVCSRDKMYYYPESGFHDLVFKAKQIIEEHFGLEPRNILLTGESSGSVMAKEFVLKYYDKVDAAAYNGGHNNIFLHKPEAADATTACLIMHTLGDSYQKPSKLLPLYIQALRMIGPPGWEGKGGKFWHHASSQETWGMIHLFIKGVVELRESRGGKVPDYREWPYQMKDENGKTLYFPSEEFKTAWNKMPHATLNKLFLNPEVAEKENIYFTPIGSMPRAVMIYIHDPKEDDIPTSVSMADTLYYLSRQGIAACSVKVTDDQKDSLKRVVKLLQEVKGKEEWKDLPIHVSGLGIGGEIAAVAALRYGDDIENKKITVDKGNVKFVKTQTIRHKRVNKIIAINARSSGDIAGVSIRQAGNISGIPLVMLYSKDFLDLIPKHIPDHTTVKEVNAKGYTLDRKWFSTIMEHVALENRE